MSLRIGILAVLFATLACNKGTASAAPDAGASSGPRRTTSTLPPPPDGPCTSDADCKLTLESCSCACLAYVGELPPVPNDKWATMCSGGPPGNCGVASPCMNATAACDTATKKCVVKR